MMRNLAPGDLVKKAWDLCNQDWPGCSIMNVMHLKAIVFCGGLVFLQCFVHVQSHFQPLPKLILFWPRLIWMVEVTRFASTSKTYDIHEYSSTAFECEPWLPFLLVFLCPAIFFTLRNHCLRPCGLVETQSTAATQSWKEPLLFP